MPTKKAMKRSPPPRNQALPVPARRVRGQEFGTKRDSRGIVDKAAKVEHSVVVAAVAGAVYAMKRVA